jgi:hypothetical protein
MPLARQMHLNNRKEARALLRCARNTLRTSLSSSLNWRQSGEKKWSLAGQDNVDRLRVAGTMHHDSSSLGDTGSRIAFVMCKGARLRTTNSKYKYGTTETPICSACIYDSFNDAFSMRLWAVPWLRRLIIGLSSRRPGFNPGLVHVRFVVVLGHFFPSNSVLPFNYHSTYLLIHLPSIYLS